MSKISKILKKAQESRTNLPEPSESDIVNLADAPDDDAQRPLRLLLGICAAGMMLSLTALGISIGNLASKQTNIRGLEKNLNANIKKIDELSAVVERNKKDMDAQIHYVKLMIKNEADMRKNQFVSAASVDGIHYGNIKNAILDDKERINDMTNSLKDLKQSVKRISDEVDELKLSAVSATPVNGN